MPKRTDIATLDSHFLGPPPSPHVSRVDPSPGFPVDVFPPEVATYLTSAADSARVPVAMVALPFLSLAGATIGNRLRFDVGNGWIEYPALWVAVIAVTGAGKTPGLHWARLPFDQLANERPGAKHDKDAPGAIFVTDASIPAIARRLQASPGLALIHDELYGFLSSIGPSAHGAGVGSPPYLSLWSSQPIVLNRGRHPPLSVMAPVLGICGGIQPLLWSRFRDRQTQGLLERFIPLVYGLPRSYWAESLVRNASPPHVEAITAHLRNIRAHALPGYTITPTSEAGDVWTEWFNDNLDRTLAASLLRIGYYQKLPSQVARTAIVLHALWHPDQVGTPISAATMDHAVTLGDFYRAHVDRSLVFLGGSKSSPVPQPGLDDRIQRLLAAHTDGDGWMTRTDLHAALGRPCREELTAALADLVQRSIVHCRRERLPHAKRPVEYCRLVRRPI